MGKYGSKSLWIILLNTITFGCKIPPLAEDRYER
jgi:hypothetical protein